MAQVEELNRYRDELARQNQDLQVIQERVLQEQRRYQDLFDFAPDAYLVTDISGVIQEANHTAQQMFGRQTLVGEALGAFIPEADQPVFRDLLRRLLQGWQARGWETWILLPEGEPRPVTLIAASMRGEGQEATGLRWLLHDLTERRRAEEALRLSEARFRTVFEFSGVGIDLVRLDGRIIASNPALTHMLGYSPEELRGMSYVDFTHPEDRARNQQLFEAVTKGEINSYRMEKRYLHKNGSVVWAFTTLSSVRDEHNRPEFVIAMVENISDLKQMEAELTEVQRRLMDNTEVERILLAQELHDGPVQDLYGITFQLAGLRDMLPDDESRAYLDGVQERLKQVVHGLRATSGYLRPPTLAPFGLEKAISSHAANFRLDHPQFQLRLELMHDGQRLPGPIRLGLYRIYQQALNNAVRHSRAVHIDVRLYLTDEEVVLEVEDDGLGFEIPAGWLNFVRSGRLGLAAASERAAAIGGELQVEAQPGDGTLVRAVVRLPAKQSD